MIADLIRGSAYAFRGFSLINRPGIRRYVAIPLLINTLLFAAVIWFGTEEFERLLDWMLPSWLDWARWILWPLFAITALLVVFYTFTVVANLVGAPFNALLSERLEAQLSGQPPPSGSGLGALARATVTAIGNEIRKLLYLVAWAIPLLILFIIPGINLAAPILWGLFGAWMLALEYADYPMGNRDMKFSAERALLRRRRGLALGFGGAIMLLTIIPVVNFFVMPVGVAGATALWVDHLARELERD